ncbi:MAG: CBS domain-containing protein [Nanobdellota archaeon]
MIDDIKQIKKLRKKLNMTQAQLAYHANVSQSLIAKLEAGTLDPAYSKVKKIQDTLQTLANTSQRAAKDIMRKEIIKLTPDSSLKITINKMKKHNISQLPVFENNNVVGLISEHFILDALSSGHSLKTPVKKVMSDAPPVISGKAQLPLVIRILKEFPLLIVSDKGKAKGIITKADLFNAM